MKKLAALLIAAVAACAAFDYGKALDQCALNNMGDRQASLQCECQVALDAGRSCAPFIEAGLVIDGGGQ